MRVHACGVCRTDLHVVDGELMRRRFRSCPATSRRHGRSAGVRRREVGQRAGVALARPHWRALVPIAQSGRENLSDQPRFTGYTSRRRFRDAHVVDAPFSIPLPRRPRPRPAAPLLCAGLIGWRSLKWRAQSKRSGATASAPRRDHRADRRRGAAGLRVHRAGDTPAQASPARWAPPGPEARTRRRRAAGRGDPVRAGGRARAAASRGPQGRARGVRRHLHEPIPSIAYAGCCGGSANRLGRQSHPGRRRSFFRSRRAPFDATPPYPSPRPTGRSPTCARAGSPARRCWSVKAVSIK